MNQLNEIANEFSVAKRQLIDKAKDAVLLEFQQVFETHPELTAVCWRQYTPYFNDGDTCYFSVHDFSVTNSTVLEDGINAIEDYCSENELMFEDLWGYTNKKYPDLVNISKFAHTDLGKQLFEEMFGDHVEVIVSRDGVDVCEYDHD